MIVGADSPLRRLPIGLKPEQRLLLDGIRFSIEMAECAYVRLANTALKATAHLEADGVEGKGFHPALMMDAWSIIDSVHRLRELIKAVSSPPPDEAADDEKRIELGGPLGGSSVVTDLRDTVQHLEQRIGGMVRSRQPILGTLWWAVPGGDDTVKIVITMPGAIVDGKTPAVIAASMVGSARPPIDHIHLTSQLDPKRAAQSGGVAELVKGEHPGTVAVSLTKLLVQVNEATAKLETQLRPQFDGLDQSSSDMFAVLYIKLEPLTQPDPWSSPPVPPPAVVP